MAGQLTITFVLLLLLVVVVVWTSIKKNKENRERALVDIILARLKIVIGFYQVTFGILDAFTFIKWPDSLAAIAKYSEMLQLNVLQIAPIHCLFPQLKVDAFESLFAILAMNAAAVAVAGTSYGIKRLLMIFRSGHLENDAEAKQISKTKELIYRNLFFFLFVTYLSTCSKTANVLPLACREICYEDNGKDCFKYLKADFTIKCHSRRYKRLVSVAYFAIAYFVSQVMVLGVCGDSSQSHIDIWLDSRGRGEQGIRWIGLRYFRAVWNVFCLRETSRRSI